jgi:hypothetical protein
MFRHRHEHSYQPAAVDHRQPPFGGTTTIVLWRCPCGGAAATSALDGNWTLAQVRGENDDRGAFVPPKKPVPPARPTTDGRMAVMLADELGTDQ